MGNPPGRCPRAAGRDGGRVGELRRDLATFPTELARRCILAGCPEWVCTTCGHDAYRTGLVLDPFAGSGTTILIALRHNRSAIGFELNPAYCDLARARITADSPLFNQPQKEE